VAQDRLFHVLLQFPQILPLGGDTALAIRRIPRRDQLTALIALHVEGDLVRSSMFTYLRANHKQHLVVRLRWGRAIDKVGAPISIGFARADFGPVRQRASTKPIEIGAPTTTLSMALWVGGRLARATAGRAGQMHSRNFATAPKASRSLTSAFYFLHSAFFLLPSAFPPAPCPLTSCFPVAPSSRRPWSRGAASSVLRPPSFVLWPCCLADSSAPWEPEWSHAAEP
jgi:hypothetical protein